MSTEANVQQVIEIAKKDLLRYTEQIRKSVNQNTVTKRKLLRSLELALTSGFVDYEAKLLSNDEKLLAPLIRNALECTMFLMAHAIEENERRKQDDKQQEQVPVSENRVSEAE